MRRILVLVVIFFAAAFSGPEKNVPIVNPWFVDTSCVQSLSGWTDQTPAPYSAGLSKKTSNPGQCNTALRWHSLSHPPDIEAIVSQEVLYRGRGRLALSYHHVSLGSGQGTIDVYSRGSVADPWVLSYTSQWSGHVGTWDWSGYENFSVPPDTTGLKIAVTLVHYGNGGAKMTGISIVERRGIFLGW